MRFMQFSLISVLFLYLMHKIRNFFITFRVYTSEMAKTREKSDVKRTETFLLTPPFFEGFHIDPLII
jgi:hypothetical protein